MTDPKTYELEVSTRPARSGCHPLLLTCLLVFASIPSPQARPGPVSGHIEAWGVNTFGQATPPPAVAELMDITAIAAGNSHSLALRQNGTVVAWGNPEGGRTSVPTGLGSVVAIAAASHSVALRADGTVVIWGSDNPAITNPPPEAVGLQAIAAGSPPAGREGSAFTVGLRTDGTVVAWGNTDTGETSPPVGLTNVDSIAAGRWHALALRTDGTVAAWGSQSFTNVPPGLNNVVAIAASQVCSFALRSDGTLVYWPEFTPVTPPPNFGPLRDVKLGNTHALALLPDQTVRVWGEGPASAVGDVPAGLSGVQAISTFENHNLVITRRPSIRSISSPLQTVVGASHSFVVSTVGEDLRYQWRLNGSDLPGETNPTLNLQNVGASHAGTYTLLVTNGFGTNTATTSLSFPPPIIRKAPQTLTRYRGEAALFSVEAEGVEPLAYQWSFNGADLPAETSAALSIPLLLSEHRGVYTVRVTDAAGEATIASPADLILIDPTRATSTFLPDVDTSIGAANPRGVSTLLSATRRNGNRNRALLRFDLSSLPTDSQVHSAHLELRVVKTPPAYYAVNSIFGLHRALTHWDGGATWTFAAEAKMWMSPGGSSGTDFVELSSASTLVAGLGLYQFGPATALREDVQFWVSNPNQNFGWFLISEQEGTLTTARHFGSSEGATPKLFVDYGVVPSPPEAVQLLAEEGALKFSIAPDPGWIYRVDYREEVHRGEWITATNAPAGTGTLPVLISLPLEGRQRFYRVLIH